MRRTLAHIANITMPRRYREGGQVRGPGTGTSDSIPAMLSDGEFVMPADTVRKVGARRLRDLIDATHTPVETRGPNHLANGGYGDSDAFAQQMEQMRNQSRQRADSVAAQFKAESDAAAAAATAAADTVAATAARSPSTGQSGGSGDGGGAGGAAQPLEQRVAQIPTGGLTAPAADGSQNRWSNTETGRNLSNLASALPGSLGGAIPAVAKTGGAISGGLDAATRLMNAGAGVAAISALPGSAAAQDFSTSSAGAGRGSVNPASVNPSAPLPVASPPAAPTAAPSLSAPTTSDVTRVGNSYSGTNVAGDITVNGRTPGGGFMNSGDTSAQREPLGMSPPAAQSAGLVGGAAAEGVGARERLMAAGTGQAPAGQISQQNMAAADNLAARQDQDARSRLMALATGPGSGPVAPGSFTGGFTGVVGSTSTQGNMLGRTPEQRLRDAEVSASSITNRPQWGGRGAENSAAMLGYRAALQQDNNIRQNQAGQDLEALRQEGLLQRESMQQSGATERTNINARRDDASAQIANRRLRLEEIAAGYTNRTADRMDRAQAELEGAKTPEAQRSARERLLALAGKTPQNEWGVQVTPATKNADGSSTQGSVWRYNKQTGETVRVDGQAQPSAQFEVGKTYVDGQGRRATFTAQGWKPA